MPKKYTVLLIALFFGMGVLFASCAGVPTKPTAANFKNPVITLDYIGTSYYEGFWYYGKSKVAMGKAPAGGGSSPVTLEFVFEIANPNSYPILLDSSQFFLYFDDYELRIVKDMNEMWIPAGKTNSKVLQVTLTPFSTYAKFLLAGKELSIKRGDKPWDKITQWWTGLPDMSFKIDVKEASFSFSADGVSTVMGFSATYP
ncbi:MAG TPA: hypothetical protein VMW09_07520 [Desulfatiglandales bacterium]|nr:hypothetical protein [Desulfatiglandales bacterium]